MLIDYDAIDAWGPELSDALCETVSGPIRKRILEQRFEYIEDALDFLFKASSRRDVIDTTLRWIQQNQVAAYHGSRLHHFDIEAIRRIGLQPLNATNRRERLVRSLEGHPNWCNVLHRLDDELRRHGSGQAAGNREGQVHLTLSKSGLTRSFNHYLLRGSEFDQHVAHALLGEEGEILLENDGIPVVIQANLPGSMAIDGAHPYFTVEMMHQNGETPNLAREFLEAWSYWLSKPGYQTTSRRLDCGIRFNETLPSELIAAIEHWTFC